MEPDETNLSTEQIEPYLNLAVQFPLQINTKIDAYIKRIIEAIIHATGLCNRELPDEAITDIKKFSAIIYAHVIGAYTSAFSAGFAAGSITAAGDIDVMGPSSPVQFARRMSDAETLVLAKANEVVINTKSDLASATISQVIAKAVTDEMFQLTDVDITDDELINAHGQTFDAVLIEIRAEHGS